LAFPTYTLEDLEHYNRSTNKSRLVDLFKKRDLTNMQKSAADYQRIWQTTEIQVVKKLSHTNSKQTNLSEFFNCGDLGDG
jgi:hypothetical protein